MRLVNERVVNAGRAEQAGGPGPAAGRKLWAVVITDGDMNVIEGENVRQEYIDAAKELYDRVDPETLGHAATEILFSKTLPALKKRGVGVSLLGIGCDARNPGRLFERGRTDFSGGAFCAEGPLLRDAVAGLLEGNPVRRKEGILSHGLSERTVPAGTELDVPLKVLPGTLRTQVVIFASSGEFDVALLDAGGAPPEGARFRLLGEGRPYRVGWIDGAAPGEYRLRLTSRADSALKAEVVVSCQAAVKLKIDWPDDLDPHLMGLPVLVGASVLDEGGKVVSDPGLLKEARVSFALADEADKTASGAAALAGAGGPAGAGIRFSIPTEGLGPGKCTATVRLEVFPRDPGSEGGPYLYRGPAESSELRLVPGVLVEFGKKEVLVGQEVPVRAASTSALDAPPPEITVTATTPSLAPDVEPVTLKLSVAGAERAEYVGTASFEKAGKWKLLPGGSEEFLVRPGETPEVEVRALELRILSAEPPHEELESLEFRVPYCETSAPESEANRLPVLLDLAASGAATPGAAVAPETVPALVVGFVPSESLLEFQERLEEGGEPPRSPIAFEISTEGERDAEGRLKATISLKVGTEKALPLSPGLVGPGSLVSSEFYKSMWPVPSCEPGSLDVRATVGEIKLTKQRPVKITFPDFWTKAIRIYAKYWIPAAAVLAFLLLLLTWWLFRAKFNEHQLRMAEDIEKQGGGFYRLRSLGEGKSRRRAIGTPEVTNAVRFRIKGSRLFGRGRVAARPMADDCRVFVNETDSGDWARLTHGDRIRVENGEGQSCAYYYFERTPTAAELEAIAKGFFVVLGPDEFVIEGLPDR